MVRKWCTNCECEVWHSVEKRLYRSAESAGILERSFFAIASAGLTLFCYDTYFTCNGCGKEN